MKTAVGYLWRIVVTAVLTVLATAVAGAIMMRFMAPPAIAGSAGSGSGSILLYQLAACMLYAGALAYPVRVSTWRGWRLVGAAFLALFGLNVALTQIEAYVFLKDLSQSFMLMAVIIGSVQAASVALLLAALFGKLRGPAEQVLHPRVPAGAWAARLAICSFAYLVLYYVAGTIIYPFVQPFYESQHRSVTLLMIVSLQLLRGALYVAVVLPLIRSMPVERWRIALAIAVLYPIVSGIAPLLGPNPILPDYVRHVHMIEIGWSNFVFGLLVGWLVRGKSDSSAVADPPTARTERAPRRVDAVRV
jgi:hypothetical protein